MQFYEINICQVMNFRLCIVYNKHEMIKIYSQIGEKVQILSQMLEQFSADCNRKFHQKQLARKLEYAD